MSDSRAPYLPPQRPYLSRRVFVMRGKKAFYLRVSEWGGLDSNQRPTDYESGNREGADLQEFLNMLVRGIT